MAAEKKAIFVAGHRGLVGSAIVRKLEALGQGPLLVRTRSELDLLNQEQVHRFFRENQVGAVYLAAARVGGIHANQSFQADFLYENLMIACNVIHAAAESNVDRLLFLGSSCIYPKLAPQPIREQDLLTGALEPTNEGYALAKIAGLKLCEKYAQQYGKEFISAMPTNLYGTQDNFHPEHSHVIPGMMRRFHEAKIQRKSSVRIWGSGKPLREFLHVDDLASALVFLMENYRERLTINVGSGEEVSIGDLARLMRSVVGFEGEIEFDSSKPDGTPRKLMDSSRLRALGWTPRYSLAEGLRETYAWALKTKVFDAP